MRMNISVSDELKARMDKVECVNWSAIACQAFSEKLATLLAGKVKNMQDVIQRLKASKQMTDNDTAKRGFAEGQDWAKQHAEAIQLKQLSEARDRNHDWSFDVGGSAYGPAERFFFIIDPAADGDREQAVDFWQQILGDDAEQLTESEFVQAFAEGAMNIWAQVEDKL